MRINPITIKITDYTNNKYNSYQSKPDNSSYKNFDLNLLNNNCNQISFKAGINKETLELVQKIPLTDRLGTLLGLHEYDELILVGKKLAKAKNGLMKSVESINCAIRKVFFIPDEKFNGYLGFVRSPEWEHEVINLNDFKIGLISNNKTYELEPHNSFYVQEGDTIIVQGSTLGITLNPKADLRGFIKNFSLNKSFKNEVNFELERINKKMFSSLAQDVQNTPNRVTFKDVGGQDELIQEMKKSIIYPLRYPEAYSNFEINRGFILYGPPGTGKTHIARALANEADVNFQSLNGTELESKWVGESEANWRNLFEEAKEKQPTILFIDELDAIAKARGGKDVYGDKVVNQILTLMTDLDNNRENVFVIGATNNFKALDSAITRSGRFGKHLEVKLPDKNGVQQIFDIHTSNKPLDRNIDKESIIQKLFDLKVSGADIKYVVNEAHTIGYDRVGIFEKMENKTLSSNDLRKFWITQDDFTKAINKFVETRNGTDRTPIGFNK